jgi:hypothetical protein
LYAHQLLLFSVRQPAFKVRMCKDPTSPKLVAVLNGNIAALSASMNALATEHDACPRHDRAAATLAPWAAAG